MIWIIKNAINKVNYSHNYPRITKYISFKKWWMGSRKWSKENVDKLVSMIKDEELSV